MDETIRSLNLYNVKDTIIGNQTVRGISGGERKRTSIAKEIIYEPKILFVDEPTSGLDSFQAAMVVQNLKEMAKENRIIITVIHQPSSQMYQLFDNLMLLAQGRVIYFGKASRAMEYFTRLGYQVPVFFNPGDFFVDVISCDIRTIEAEVGSRQRLDYLINNWQLVTMLTDKDRNLSDPGDWNLDVSGETEDKSQELEQPCTRIYTRKQLNCCNWFSDLVVLSWRSALSTYRDLPSVIIKSTTCIFFAVLIALLFQNLTYSQDSIQDRIGLLFFVAINQAFGPCIGVLDSFCQERVLIQRERVFANSYHLSSYFVGRVIVEIPMQVTLVVLYSVIVYFSTGLQLRTDKFFIFLGFVILSVSCSVSLGYFISCVASNTNNANGIVTPVLIIFILTGGFFLSLDSLPPGSYWVSYISYIGWTFKALTINELTGLTFICDRPNPIYCTETGEDVLAQLTFDNFILIDSLIANLVIVFGFLLLAYCSLRLTLPRFVCIKMATKN